jgi:hypothetical protein
MEIFEGEKLRSFCLGVKRGAVLPLEKTASLPSVPIEEGVRIITTTSFRKDILQSPHPILLCLYRRRLSLWNDMKLALEQIASDYDVRHRYWFYFLLSEVIVGN